MPNIKRCTLLFVTVSSLVLGTSCSREAIRAFGDLFELRKELIAQYSVKNVNVEIQNGNTLIVSFINSPFNALEAEEKEERAREIASFAKDKYASIKRIGTIWVAFVEHKQYAVVSYTNSRGSFGFKVSELEKDRQHVADEREAGVKGDVKWRD